MWEGKQGMRACAEKTGDPFRSRDWPAWKFYYHKYQKAQVLNEKLKFGIITPDEVKV